MAIADRMVKTVEKRLKRYLKRARQMNRHTDRRTVHKFRIASRNMLVIAPLLDESCAWKKRVKQQLKALGPLRDLQVLAARFSEGDPLHRELEKAIDRELRNIHLDIPKTFRSQLKSSCTQAVHRMGKVPEHFEKAAASHFSAVTEKLLTRLAAINSDQPKTFHRLRIAYKNFRYLAVFIHDVGLLQHLDKKALKQWQMLLGNIQDDTVAAAWLQEKHPEARDLISSIQQHSQALRQQFDDEKVQFQQFVAGLQSDVE